MSEQQSPFGRRHDEEDADQKAWEALNPFELDTDKLRTLYQEEAKKALDKAAEHPEAFERDVKAYQALNKQLPPHPDAARRRAMDLISSLYQHFASSVRDNKLAEARGYFEVAKKTADAAGFDWDDMPGGWKIFEEELSQKLHNHELATGETRRYGQISLEKRSDDYMAYIGNDKGRWESGSTPVEAVGKILKNYPEISSLTWDQRSNDVMAQVSDDPALWEAASTPALALGKLYLRLPELWA